MKFISNCSNLKLVLKPSYYEQVGPHRNFVQGESVKFDGHVYETSDRSVIQKLRKHRLFGIEFIAEKEKDDQKKDEGAE